MSDKVLERLRKIEAALIEKNELDSLGHRILFNTKTGWSENIFGCYCNPDLLDEDGWQVKL